MVEITFTVRVLLVFAHLLAASNAQPAGTIPPPTNTLQVFALPVGQGDCTIMQCPNGKIVVYDCGSSGGNRMSAVQVKTWLGSRVNNVEAIFITHADRDHYNYLHEIYRNTANVQAVILGGPSARDRIRASHGNTRNWLDALENANKLYFIRSGNEVNYNPRSSSSCIGNCIATNQLRAMINTDFCSNTSITFNILAANVGTTANEQSIIMKVVVDQWSMLLSGDMEGQASLDIARQLGAGLQSVVYKMSHHGASNKANKPEWLAAIRPQYAFASSGYNYGRCKHPRCETINRILNLNSITMTTAHTFQCGNPGGTPTVNTVFRYNMLGTSMNATYICLLTYVSSTSSQPQKNCFPPNSGYRSIEQPLSTDDANNGECDDEDGGALSMIPTSLAIGIFVIVVFYFINDRRGRVM